MISLLSANIYLHYALDVLLTVLSEVRFLSEADARMVENLTDPRDCSAAASPGNSPREVPGADGARTSP